MPTYMEDDVAEFLRQDINMIRERAHSDRDILVCEPPQAIRDVEVLVLNAKSTLKIKMCCEVMYHPEPKTREVCWITSRF